MMRKPGKKTKKGLIQLLRLLSPAVKPAPFEGPLNRVLIIAQEKLGDAVLLTPLVRGLKEAAPGVEIDIAAMSILNSPVFAFFENDRNIRTVYHVKENYFRFFRQVSRQRYDVLINTKDHPSFNFLILTVLIKARYKSGIGHVKHHGFYHWMLASDFHRPMVEKYVDLLGFLPSAPVRAVRPYIPAGPVSAGIKDICRQMKGLNVTGVNLSAGHPDREWPVTSWHALIRRMNRTVIVLSMPGRLEDKETLENEFPGIIIKTPPTGNIYEAAELMKHLSLLITPDTSLVHVASATRTPVIGLYTSAIVHQKRFAPVGIPYERVISPARTIAGIPVSDVFQAVKKMNPEPA